MITEPKKLTVASTFSRPTKQQIQAFDQFSTGMVSDALDGSSALDNRIGFLGREKDLPFKAVGPAMTARNRPGDILGTLAAMKFLEAGDVLVCGVGGHKGCSAAGDLVMAMLKNNGGVGFVTDGPMRDYAGIVEVGLPVWCAGLNPASPHTSGPSEVGLPIQIGNQRISSGDMIVADLDGVVVVPFELIDETIERCKQIVEREGAYEAEITGGRRVSQKALSVLSSGDVEFVA